MTVVYVTHALDTIAGGPAFNRNGVNVTNCHAISGANSLNVAGGSTAGSKDFGLVTGFFGLSPRFALKLANAESDSMTADVDSTSNFRVNSIVFNSTTSAVGDVSRLTSGIAQRGWRYDSWSHSGNVRVFYMTSGATIAPTQLRLGGNTNATTSSALNDYWYEGGLGDVLVFSSVLTTEQRQLVEGYLATKYGCQSSSYLGSTSTSYNNTVSYTITSGSSSTGTAPYTVTVGGTFTTAFVNRTPVVISGVTTATGFNGTWILTSSSTSSITFLSPTSPGTWASGNGGTISGVTVSNGNFIHPYSQTLTNISPTLSLTQQYAQGLVGWFDATNSASITFSSGSLVSSWASSGGSVTGLALAQATVLNQPTLVQNAQNGLPGMRFSTGSLPSATYNITSGSSTGAGPYTITLGGTFTTAFTNGSQVTIAGVSNPASGYNGTWTLTSSTTTSITFNSATNIGAWVAGGTIAGTTSTGYPSSSNLRSAATYTMDQLLTISGNADVTWFTVLKHINALSNSTFFSLSNGSNSILMRYSTNFTYYGYRQDTTYSAVANNTPHIVIYTIKRSVARSIVIVNGTRTVNTNTFAPDVPNSTTSQQLGMGGGGANPASNNDPFGGDIYEHVMFRYAMTDQQIFQIEGYLAWKWGLQASLGTTHPYYKTSP